jgi:hypothetical protein
MGSVFQSFHFANLSTFKYNLCWLTACVTGGWREPTHETGNCHRSEKSRKNAPHTSRPVHAVLGGADYG